jgi:hypothetical protein
LFFSSSSSLSDAAAFFFPRPFVVPAFRPGFPFSAFFFPPAAERVEAATDEFVEPTVFFRVRPGPFFSLKINLII